MRLYRRCLICLVALLLALPSAAGAYYSAHTYRNGSRDEKRVAVTVDDMFNTAILAQILDLCDQTGARITLFPVGKRILESDRDLWQRVVDSGHEIGNHTNNHRKLTKLDGYQIGTEVRTMQKRLNAALGYEYPLTILRPPYGTLGENGGSSRVGRELYKLGYHTLILWDVSETDPDEALKKTRNGSILLFHTNAKDYRCLEQLIPALQAEGYTLVTVSELLHLDANGDAPTATPEATSTPAPTTDAQPTGTPKADATVAATATPATVAAAEATATPKATATVKMRNQ